MKRSFIIPLIASLVSVSFTPVWAKEAVRTIVVQGNRRVETPTVLSYIDVKPGAVVDEDKIEETLKNLFATGLFSDVIIDQAGDQLLINVVENKIINRISFEGNSRLKDEILQSEIAIKPREVYTLANTLEAAQKIRDMYRLSGRYGARVEPKTVERDQNRVDLVFEINEGKPTRINKILFVGNKEFTDARLQRIIMTKESRWYRFFSTDDTYDADRMSFDKELLRRYYNEHGYADFVVDSAVAELDPDDQEFYLTYTVTEGKPYTFGDVKVSIKLPCLPPEGMDKLITFEKGDVFNSREVEKTVEKLTIAIGEKGFAFVEIEPKLNRNPKTCAMDLEFLVKDGRHVYINRINIIGNDRTNDSVIRREFRLSEGDAFNSVLLKRTEQRLQNLDFFKKVDIKQSETSTPDKVDLNVEVEDKPTGSLQFSGGYSTSEGPLGTVTMNERNFMGKGYDLYASAMVAQRSMEFHGGMTDPYFLDRPLTTGLDIFHKTRKFNTQTSGWAGFRQTQTGATIPLGYEIMDRLGQNWNYTLSKDSIDDMRRRVSPFLLAQKGNWVMSSLGHALFYDGRNNSVAPSSGFFAGINNNLAGLGGNVRYLKNSFSTGAYLSLDEESKWVFSAKGSVGIMSGLGKTTRVADRFELGAESLRGFSAGGVGPRDMRTGDSLGGLYYYKGTAELLVPLGLPPELGLKGSIFMDVGSVWNFGQSSPYVFGNTPSARVGAGAGISWRSPFGLIGIYYAPYVHGQKYVDRVEKFNVTFGSQF